MTFLERYQHGEHIAVWTELNTLGERVRARKLRDDAHAVAIETMRRAKRNIETLIPRLRERGYVFNETFPLLPPAKNTAAKLKAFEKHLNGKLPFSLIAFWLQFGQISFLGSHPTLQTGTADPLVVAPLDASKIRHPEPPFFPPVGAWQTSVEAWRRSLRAEGVSPAEIEVKLAPSIAGFETQDLENENLRAIPFDSRVRFPLGPDELTKAEVAGGTYDVLLPQPTADFPLQNAVGTPNFVDYLRHSIQHAGFRDWPGSRLELEALTKDLLPL